MRCSTAATGPQGARNCRGGDGRIGEPPRSDVRMGQLRAPQVVFHLCMPASAIDVARRMASDYQVALSELWSYDNVGDQVQFTLIQRSSEAPRPAAQAWTAPESGPSLEPPQGRGSRRERNPAASRGTGRTKAARRTAKSSGTRAGGSKSTSAPSGTEAQIGVARLQVTRDQRDEEHVPRCRRRRRKAHPDLSWFRTTQHPAIGRAAFDEGPYGRSKPQTPTSFRLGQDPRGAPAGTRGRALAAGGRGARDRERTEPGSRRHRRWRRGRPTVPRYRRARARRVGPYRLGASSTRRSAERPGSASEPSAAERVLGAGPSRVRRYAKCLRGSRPRSPTTRSRTSCAMQRSA